MRREAKSADTSHSELVDHLRLSRAEGVGAVSYRRLLARYGTAGAALDALPRLARVGGRSGPPALPSSDEATRELEALARLGGRLVVFGQPDYPPCSPCWTMRPRF